MIKHIYFDVAGTLIGKPGLIPNIQKALASHNHHVSQDEIRKKHKLLSEVIHFPDRTDEAFYKGFNSEILYLLGIIPTDELCDAIFKSCTYLPWVPFKDTQVLGNLNYPLGVISNFNSSLKDKLNDFFGPIFQHVYVSEELRVAKPDLAFFSKALELSSLQPSEVLYIGDSVKLDLAPALSLGIKSLLIDRDNFYPSLPNRITDLSQIKNYL